MKVSDMIEEILESVKQTESVDCSSLTNQDGYNDGLKMKVNKECYLYQRSVYDTPYSDRSDPDEEYDYYDGVVDGMTDLVYQDIEKGKKRRNPYKIKDLDDWYSESFDEEMREQQAGFVSVLIEAIEDQGFTVVSSDGV